MEENYEYQPIKEYKYKRYQVIYNRLTAEYFARIYFTHTYSTTSCVSMLQLMGMVECMIDCYEIGANGE